ncbi:MULTISPECIES: response regulator [Pseudomonadaceae]|jgi:CheY-like chemotaxis protein|uniref:Response regulator n=3 Tax=Pseudomonadaceae TaxID=135621 RepID=A0A1G5MXS2_9PSED|nr:MULTISPECIES: response regulator [Pseudomonas]HCV76112.1 response regulator [Pseudomonas sp.]KIZ50714.1 histidine kinase [Pseudomonas oryzihabitans]KTT57240.1 histidine kinase [Pseudomonas psychrotolerans]MBA1260056.1 response regulator [Pseudomonas psychrotolerans]MBH3330356.1 response regulator [Pseudomonas oryzihabitans]
MKPVVVVVEDENMLLGLMEEVLEGEGFQVHTFGTADQAWEYLSSARPTPDLLITDVRMPGAIDGLELARRVKQQLPGLPIIVSSGYFEELQPERAPDIYYLPKPWRFDDLLAGCFRFLNQRKG